jgi:hypothetical protein
MAHTDFRTVIPNFWYTSQQIVDIGRAWELEDPEHVFIYSENETPYRTGINYDLVSTIDTFPRKLLLPLNKGNAHWTAVAVDIKDVNGQIQVAISFTDSLDTKSNVARLPHQVKS